MKVVHMTSTDNQIRNSSQRNISQYTSSMTKVIELVQFGIDLFRTKFVHFQLIPEITKLHHSLRLHCPLDLDLSSG